VVAQTGTRSLIDAVIPVNGYNARIARDIALIVLFGIITAGLARFSVQLPFTPVPVTGQTLFVPNDKVMESGLHPFIAGDLIKLYIAAISVPVAWSLLNLKQPRDEPWT